MFFSKRVKKSFEIMEERNRQYLESMKEKDAGGSDPADETEERKEPLYPEESSAGVQETEIRAEREIEEEIREDDGIQESEVPEDTALTEAAGGAGKSTARRMHYAPARDLTEEEAEEKAEEFHREENKLEKGDIPAMILSALLVFGPIFLVLGGILALAWIFLH